jgi:glycosyltransferase involved in cell wall biosynthesis
MNSKPFSKADGNHRVPGIVAYGLHNIECGVSTVYLNLAKGLRARGWQIFSVGVGTYAARTYNPAFADEGSVVLAGQETETVPRVRAFLEWVEQKKVDLVIPNYEGDIIAALPCLPRQVRCLNICHGVIRSHYLAATAHLSRLSRVVALSRFQERELAHRFKVPPKKICLIPNGLDLDRFIQVQRLASQGAPLRLIYLGRINNGHKGVLVIPPILRELKRREIPFSLKIVGSGVELPRLEAAVNRSGFGSVVTFLGQQPPMVIPELLAQADIMVMPTRWEAFGMVIIEAMAAGCVPVATLLPGITDMMVTDGVNGFLCPMGKARAFAKKISLLHRDRRCLAEMSEAARHQVCKNFSLERMTADYDRLFTQVLTEPQQDWQAFPPEDAVYPWQLQPTWRAKIPEPVKNFLRPWMLRFAGRLG